MQAYYNLNTLGTITYNVWVKLANLLAAQSARAKIPDYGRSDCDGYPDTGHTMGVKRVGEQGCEFYLFC